MTVDYEKLKNRLGYLLLGILLLVFIYLLTRLFPLYATLLRTFFRILIPFFIAIFAAYLLRPIVEKLHKHHVPRWLAIVSIYLFVIVSLGLVGYYGYPALVQQLTDLQSQLPELIESYRNVISDLYQATSFLPETFHDRMDQLFDQAEEASGTWITNGLKGITHAFDYIIILAVIPVLLFYFLKDFQLIKATLMKLVPAKYQKETKRLVRDIDKSLGNYIRGQLIVCFFVFLTTYLVYLFVKMKYPLLLAIFMGVMNVIPYFGPIIGAVPAVIIAVTISFKQMVYVLIGVIIVQLIESNLLSPYIVGRSVHIHPIIIIFALLVGSELAGILGMVIAVPVLAVIHVVIRHIRSFSAKD